MLLRQAQPEKIFVLKSVPSVILSIPENRNWLILAVELINSERDLASKNKFQNEGLAKYICQLFFFFSKKMRI
jgi:hypothetical protein